LYPVSAKSLSEIEENPYYGAASFSDFTLIIIHMETLLENRKNLNNWNKKTKIQEEIRWEI
jgi:hypothetical protein